MSTLGIVVGFLVLTESGLQVVTSQEALYFQGAERLLAKREKILKGLAEER